MRPTLRHVKHATLLACAALIAACSPPPPDSMDKMANGNIVEIRGLNTEQLTFVTRNRIVTMFATDAYNIMREMKRHYPQEFNSHPVLSEVNSCAALLPPL